MADPQAAVANQLRNIEARTGKTFAQLCRLIADSGLSKVGEQRKMLMEQLGLGYGDANMLAIRAKEAATAAPEEADPLETIYSGNKAPLRALHDQLSAAIDNLGPHEKAAKKSNVSFRRKKQFALIGPATKDRVEVGLNAKELPAAPRLKPMPPGGMCQYTVRLGTAAEIDGELIGWIKAAYDAAG